MANKIEVFQGNSMLVTCTITGLASLAGYDVTLTVKADARDTDVLFEIAGSVTDLEVEFQTTIAHNTREAAKYVYEVTIEDDAETPTEKYTAVQDTYEIVESVTYDET